MYGTERLQPPQFFVNCPQAGGAQSSWDWPFMFFFTTNYVGPSFIPFHAPNIYWGTFPALVTVGGGNGLPPGQRTHTGLPQDSVVSRSSLGLGAITFGACYVFMIFEADLTLDSETKPPSCLAQTAHLLTTPKARRTCQSVRGRGRNAETHECWGWERGRRCPV